MPGNNKIKIYILGGSGFLGGSATAYFKEHGYDVLADRIDITNSASLASKFSEYKPDVVINFAGVRAYPNIDWCEDHKEETIRVNVAGAINAMLAAIEVGAYPIQISSGCIYSGGSERLFTEEDEPNFYGSFYSRMRIVMQQSLAELPVLQARIRMPISKYSHPRNLINKLISYKKVISVPNSVTLIEDLFPALDRLISLRFTGILNLTNDGYLKHEDIMRAYKEVIDPNHEYELIELKELEEELVKARRSNCVLSNAKARSLGISMPALDNLRIREIMSSYKEGLKK